MPEIEFTNRGIVLLGLLVALIVQIVLYYAELSQVKNDLMIANVIALYLLE